MLVSFIIPAYNAANTIVRCLDSICDLSLKRNEFEVIVIDDCSTDETVPIIEQYQKQIIENEIVRVEENLIFLKQQENHRQGAARNRGVKIAKGKFICFVDADDAVTEKVVAAIYLAQKKQTDMTAFHYAYVKESGVITNEADRLSFENEQIFTGIEMQNEHPYWSSAPWGYIYRKEFLEEVNYPFCEGVLYEDSDFVAVHLYHAKRMVYSPELGYFAYYREGSTTHSLTYKNLADYLLLGTRMMTLYERVMCERADDIEKESVNRFAEGVLEGACFNVEQSCRRLLKLDSLNEVRAYYERIDERVNRLDIVANKSYRSYYWNVWTGLCMRHKMFVIFFISFVIPIYHVAMKLKA